jgi:hypothetical protein
MPRLLKNGVRMNKVSLSVERLHSRIVPATCTWQYTGGGVGDGFSSVNWVNGEVPNSSDDVIVIPSGTGDIAFTSPPPPPPSPLSPPPTPVVVQVDDIDVDPSWGGFFGLYNTELSVLDDAVLESGDYYWNEYGALTLGDTALMADSTFEYENEDSLTWANDNDVEDCSFTVDSGAGTLEMNGDKNFTAKGTLSLDATYHVTDEDFTLTMDGATFVGGGSLDSAFIYGDVLVTNDSAYEDVTRLVVGGGDGTLKVYANKQFETDGYISVGDYGGGEVILENGSLLRPYGTDPTHGVGLVLSKANPAFGIPTVTLHMKDDTVVDSSVYAKEDAVVEMDNPTYSNTISGSLTLHGGSLWFTEIGHLNVGGNFNAWTSSDIQLKVNSTTGTCSSISCTNASFSHAMGQPKPQLGLFGVTGSTDGYQSFLSYTGSVSGLQYLESGDARITSIILAPSPSQEIWCYLDL